MEETVWAHVKTRITPPRKIVRDISANTEGAILRAMNKDPEKRFHDYDEMILTLEASRSELLKNVAAQNPVGLADPTQLLARQSRISELVSLPLARLAQLVEQQFCNLQVTRSSRVSGSIFPSTG